MRKQRLPWFCVLHSLSSSSIHNCLIRQSLPLYRITFLYLRALRKYWELSPQLPQQYFLPFVFKVNFLFYELLLIPYTVYLAKTSACLLSLFFSFLFFYFLRSALSCSCWVALLLTLLANACLDVCQHRLYLLPCLQSFESPHQINRLAKASMTVELTLINLLWIFPDNPLYWVQINSGFNRYYWHAGWKVDQYRSWQQLHCDLSKEKNCAPAKAETSTMWWKLCQA